MNDDGSNWATRPRPQPGDPHADVMLDSLSRRFHAVLLRYFIRRGIDAQDAPDLVQEVFAKLAPRGALDDVRSVEGYMFAMAANIATDHFRRRKTRTDVHADWRDDIVVDDIGADRDFESRQELACIVGALNEMPERMRNILVLARLESLPRSEIAARLGISKSLVEKQIALATACLADRRKRLT